MKYRWKVKVRSLLRLRWKVKVWSLVKSRWQVKVLSLFLGVATPLFVDGRTETLQWNLSELGQSPGNSGPPKSSELKKIVIVLLYMHC